MPQAVGSFVINLQAKIEGYQQEIEKIKKALASVGADSDIGKSLIHQLTAVQKQVDVMSKHMTQRISSESQLARLNDQINEIDSGFLRIGQTMQGIRMSDLDTSKFSAELQKLQNEANQLKTNLDTSAVDKFQKAVDSLYNSKGGGTKRAFDLLGIDPKSLTLDNYQQALQTAYDENKERIAALKEQQQELQNIQNQAEASKQALVPQAQIDINSDQIKNVVAQFQTIKREFNQTAADTFTKTFSDSINNLKISEDQKKKLQEQLNNVFNSENIINLQSNLSSFANAFRTASKMTAAQWNSTLGTLPANMFDFSTYLNIPQSSLDNVKNQLQELFSSLSLEGTPADSLITTILQQLTDGNVTGAITTLTNNLNQMKDAAGKDTQEIEQNIAKTKEQFEQLSKELQERQRVQKGMSGVQQQFSKAAANVGNELLPDKQRLAELQSVIEKLQSGALTDVLNMGGTISADAEQQLRANAEAAQQYQAQLEQVKAREQMVGKIQGVVQRWFSIYAAVRMVGQAFNEVKKTLSELDATITEIAIVTDMSQQDLWGQMKDYTAMARQYASSISGVYKVSQLYYQQGLQTSDVMALTEQTLKMARISGLDYATATDYMTNAIRSFKMEMTDAQNVVDVYSAVAASSATSVTELATAMSKTASSAEAVGSSFENTTAMMAVMIEATREAPENIGSAMKSIISRYGEMTSDPTKLVDSEGEEMSLNRVDTALQTVGITIHDTMGQFRDFDDVIMELAQKWDTIDTNTQRYIATIMAGNRQQSRFLAMVSNYERLSELSEQAAESQDASTLQVLKTMDSISAKTQQLQTSIQSLYVEGGFEELYKGVLDFGNGIATALNNLDKIGGKPLAAVTAIGAAFYNLANIVSTAFNLIRAHMDAHGTSLAGKLSASFKDAANTMQTSIDTAAQTMSASMNGVAASMQSSITTAATSIENTMLSVVEVIRAAFESLKQSADGVGPEMMQRFMTPKLMPGKQQPPGVIQGEGYVYTDNTPPVVGSMPPMLALPASTQQQQSLRQRLASSWAKGKGKISGSMAAHPAAWSMGLSAASLALSGIAANQKDRRAQGWLNVGSGALSGAAMGVRYGGLHGAVIGGAIGMATSFVSNFSNIFQDGQEKLKELQEESTKKNNEALQKAADTKSLSKQIENLRKLERAQYDSAEAQEEYYTAAKQLTDTYPELIGTVEDSGNVTVDLATAEATLAKVRADGVKAAQEAALAAYKTQQQAEKNAQNDYEDKVYGDTSVTWRNFKQSFAENLVEQLWGDIEDQQGIEKDNLVNLILSGNADSVLNYVKPDKRGKFEEQLVAAGTLSSVPDASQITYKIKNENLKDIADLVNAARSAEDMAAALDEFKRQKSKISYESLTQVDQQYYDYLDYMIRDIAPEKAAAKREKTLMEATVRSGAARVISAVNDGIDAPVLEHMQGINKILLQEGMSEWNTVEDKSEESYETFLKQLPQQVADWTQEWNQWWVNLGTSGQQRFNELSKTFDRLTTDEARTRLETQFGITGKQQQAIIDAYYKDTFDLTGFNNAINSRTTQGRKVGEAAINEHSNLLKKLGSSELSAVLDYYDQINSYVEGGALTAKRGNTLLSKILHIGEIIRDPDQFLTSDPQKIDQAERILYDNQDWSLQGIFKLQERFAEIGIDDGPVIDALDGLKDYVPSNVIAQIDSLTNTLTKSFEDYGTAVSNAMKGMDLKKASELAGKLGKKITDFKYDPVQGLYYFDNLSEIYQAYFGQDGYIAAVEDNVEDYQKQLKSWGQRRVSTDFNPDILTEDDWKQQLQDFNLLSSSDIIQAFTAYKKYIDSLGEEDVIPNWLDYIQDIYIPSIVDSNNKIKADAKNTAARAALSAGNITQFLKQLGLEASPENIAKIASGSIDGTGLKEEWSGAVAENFANTAKNTYEALVEGLEDPSKTITVTQANKGILSKFIDENKLIENMNIAVSSLMGLNIESLWKEIDSSDLAPKVKKSLYTTLHNNQFEDSIAKALSSAIDNYQSIAADTYYDLVTRGGFDESDFTLNTDGTYALKDLGKVRNSILLRALNNTLTEKEANELLAKIDRSQREASVQHVAKDIIQNYDSLSEDSIQAFANSLNTSYEYIKTVLTKNDDGTYRIDFGSLQALLKEAGTELSDTLIQMIDEQLDQILEGVTGLASNQDHGYTKIADMQKFVQKLSDNGIQKINGDAINNIDELFAWDDSIHAFTLTNQGIIAQALLVKKALQNAPNGQKQIQQLLADSQRQLAERLDFASMFQGNKAERTKAQKDFYKGVEDYNAFVSILGEDAKQLNSIALKQAVSKGGYSAVKAAQQIAQLSGNILSDSDIETIYRASAEDYLEAMEQMQQSVGSVVSETAARILFANGYGIESLGDSGQAIITSAGNLVGALEQLYQGLIKNNTATLEEINTLYARILTEKSDANIVDTLSNAESMSFDALSELFTKAGINFENAFKTLSDAQILEDIGGGNVRIKDFDLFSQFMGWNKQYSEAYIKALKSTNSSMIDAELDMAQGISDELVAMVETPQKAGKNIKIDLSYLYATLDQQINNELTAAAKAQAQVQPDQADIDAYIAQYEETEGAAVEQNAREYATRLAKERLPEVTQADALNLKLQEYFQEYGATLENGILTISDQANIPEIAKGLAQFVKDYGGEAMEDFDLGPIFDAIAELMKGIADDISKGIEGTLTRAEAATLKLKVKNNFGLDLDFTETANGLQIATDQAIQLYYAIQSVDRAAASVVFDGLKTSLSEAGAECENISATMASIKRGERALSETPDNAKLRERVDLYKEIAAQQMQDPDQYNFMDRALPDYLKGPENYWNSIGKMFTSINNAAKNQGRMGISDFYNMVTELNNMAALTGNKINFLGQELNGDMTSAANLIEQGLGTLTNIDGKGAMINLGSIGMNFAAGAEGMGADVEKGIHDMAKSQIDMLDGMIALLETIVQMENLGDVAGKDMTIELGDIFVDGGNIDPTDGLSHYTEKYKEFADNLIKLSEDKKHKDLKKALDGIKVNGITLREFFSDAVDGAKNIEMDTETYTAIVSSLWKMYQSGNYDLDNLVQSIQEVAGESKFEGVISVGDQQIAIGYGVSITTEDGKWKVNGKEYTDYKQALMAEKARIAGLTEINVKQGLSGEAPTAEGTVEIGTNITIEGKITTEGSNFSYKDPNTNETYTGYTLWEVIDKMYKAETKGTNKTKAQWAKERKIDQKYVVNTLLVTNKDDFNKRTREDTNKIAKALADSDIVTLKGALSDIGVTFDIPDNILTEDMRKQIADLVGLEDTPILLDITANFSGDSGPQLERILTGGSVDLTVNIKKGTDEIGIDKFDNPNKGTGKEEKPRTPQQKKMDALLQERDAQFAEVDTERAAARTAAAYSEEQARKDAILQDRIGRQAAQAKANAQALAQRKDKETAARQAAGYHEKASAQEQQEHENLIAQTRLAELQASLEQSSQRVTTLEQDIQQKTARVQELTAQVDNLQTQVVQAEQEAAENAAQVEQLQSEFASLQAFLEQLQSQINNKNAPSGEGGGQNQPLQQGTNTNIEQREEIAQRRDREAAAQYKQIAAETQAARAAAEAEAKRIAAGQDFAAYVAEHGGLGSVYKGRGWTGANAPDRQPQQVNAEITTNISDVVSEVESSLEAVDVPIGANTEEATEAIQEVRDDVSSGATMGVQIAYNIPSLNLPPITREVRLKYTGGVPAAKGNVALAGGTAMASGFRRTLMGELGPELVVSNGRYFVVGQNGAEMVDLDPDAIVFNHLQTQRLLSTGQAGRGRPVTNERNAVSFATGNASGPAMASAAAALAALKNIRAMWQSMLNASLADMGQKGGGGGGGGGGKKNAIDPGFIADLERWYNLLRQIDKLEKDINYEENLRNKIESDRVINGYAYYDSQKRSLKQLDEEIARRRELSSLQKDYYDKRREDLLKSNYSKIFTFDENGLMQYNDQATLMNGDKGGLFALAKINAQNDDKSAVYTAREQYDLLKAWGFEADLKYDDEGKEIKFKDDDGKDREEAYTEAVQAFWDKAEGLKDEYDSLYDSYREQQNSLLENETTRNELLQQIIDNQISVENSVLQAIEERAQKEIDALQEERDALEESTSKYIDGLNTALSNEQKKYENQDDRKEMEKMRRQLAILQRSGGSATQIANLQQQIDSKEREQYFNAQQEQIDAIQQASDLQLERLDAQIDLMTETLEYQKEHGLLWEEVYQIMAGTEEEMLDFITANGKDWESKSTLDQHETLRELTSTIEQWIGKREDSADDDDFIEQYKTHNWNIYEDSAKEMFKPVWTEENVAKAKEAYEQVYSETSDPNKAGAAADEVFKIAREQYFKDHPDEANKLKQIKTEQPTESGGSGGGSGPARLVKKDSNWSYNATQHWHKATFSDGTVGRVDLGNHDSSRKSGGRTYCSVCGRLMSSDVYYVPTSVAGSGTLYKKTNAKAPAYAEGGLVDYTGPAMLHGTKTKPEAFLNAEETKIWRDDILSGRKGSLTNQLIEFQNLVNSMSSTPLAAQQSNSNFTIEHAEVNMNATIANDYDARRAGEQALAEMVRIARKTGNQGLRR